MVIESDTNSVPLMARQGMIRVIFSTHYYTKWGERVVVTGQGPVLGDYDLELYVAMYAAAAAAIWI